MDGLSAMWMLGQSCQFTHFSSENLNLTISTVFTSAVSAPGTVCLSLSRLV